MLCPFILHPFSRENLMNMISDPKIMQILSWGFLLRTGSLTHRKTVCKFPGVYKEQWFSRSSEHMLRPQPCMAVETSNGGSRQQWLEPRFNMIQHDSTFVLGDSFVHIVPLKKQHQRHCNNEFALFCSEDCFWRNWNTQSSKWLNWKTSSLDHNNPWWIHLNGSPMSWISFLSCMWQKMVFVITFTMIVTE